ncbi:hypothetical protein [Aquisalinus flavus]|uniref:Uncharacterized protein n=1 Tax=Aquisalinus flavus TaxID=1526572 RepID=A0A8J2Y7J0_9PROT|nr:hypothetical protein [Aquisalinus flavus]MBD0425532.1 hypothetical protein [Aquisalinus flavus]UNE48839.1 hypothetical protein FF099_12660 [Aquisalinus flavus]GGD15321.1 hypothetical protein GCM10011342_25110 [Aquisalinus flavus]
MILRRLASAIRRQDWFTVAVETLIVVFGVFIGLQVNNWNDARMLRSEADGLVLRLQVEAADVRADMAAYHALNDDILRDARRLAVRLDGGAACLAMDDEMKTLLLSVGDFPPPRFSLSSANEALETGRLSLVASGRIRDGVRDIADQMAFLERQWQRYIRIKQDTEQVVYAAAGLGLTSERDLEAQPGSTTWAGTDQYRMATPERLCGNTEVIALVTNVAVTQHIYTAYVRQTEASLEAYAAILAGGEVQ